MRDFAYNQITKMTPQRIGRYEIKSELGRGGMATVFRAYDPNVRRDVAIKLLPREFMHDRTFRARFQREAETIAALDHRAIVTIYDFGEEDGQPYLVMRLMTGGSLADHIRRGPMPVGEAASIVERIGEALDEAHAQGIIHRDLKPANILFDRRGEPAIADFGIAKLLQTDVNLSRSMLIGTPAYMSPEQAAREEIDGRCDIYSLGAILFEMLTGQLPFKADTPIGMAVKHLHEPVPRIVDVNPGLPPGCQEVIEQAMAKQKENRFATAGEMAAALVAVAQGSAPPPRRSATDTTSLPADRGTLAGAQRQTQAEPPAVIRFSSGEQVDSVEEWVALAERHWEEAVAFLYAGAVERWLARAQRPDLARLAESMRQQFAGDRSIGLERFQRAAGSFEPQRKSEAITNLDDVIGGLNYWKLRGRQTPLALTLKITNRGRGYMHGKVIGRVGWIELPQPHFGCLPGATATVGVVAHPARRRVFEFSLSPLDFTLE